MPAAVIQDKRPEEYFTFENILAMVQTRLADERMDTDSRDEKVRIRRVLLSEMIRQAAAGDMNARNFVKSRITRILSGECGINLENIKLIMDFDNLMNLPYKQKFFILMSRYDIGDIIDKYNPRYKIIDFTGMGENRFTAEILDSILEAELAGQGLCSSLASRLNVLADLVYAEAYGLSAIDCLEFANINEVGVNGCNYIWIQYKGCKIWLEFLRFADNVTLNNICKNAVSFNSKSDLSPANPGIICQRFDGSRITCSLQPFYSEPVLNLRRFNLGSFDADKLVELGTIDNAGKNLMELLVRGRANILITGGMGDGKSTTLMALVGFIPDSRAIGTIEENFELRLKDRHPFKNIVEAQAVPGRGISGAFEFMLKQSRDIIILGEITNAEEASLLINTMLRLCRGSMATFHSESPGAAIINLRNLMLRSGNYRNEMVAQADAVEAVNIVVHMGHDGSGRRFVECISEVVPAGEGHEGRLTRHAVGAVYEVRDILVREKEDFVFRNTLSDRLCSKLVKHGVEPREISSLKGIETAKQM